MEALWTTPSGVNCVPSVLAQALPVFLVVVLPTTCRAANVVVNLFHAITVNAKNYLLLSPVK